MDFLLQIWTLFVEMSPYLLLGITFVALLNLFVSKEFIIRHTQNPSLSSIIKTALLGIPLPLCSCGVIPTSVYLKKSGTSKPAVVSFLISTPQTGIDSIIATYGMLGPIFAIFRPIAAFIMGIIGGIVTMIWSNEKEKETTTNQNLSTELNKTPTEKPNFLQKTTQSLRYAFIEFIDDISTQFIIGLLIAGIIAYFVPDDFFSTAFENQEILAMIVIILLAIPMYVCATASIPIAISLMMKGFSPGVAYVLLVAGPVSNSASLSILAKVLGKKTLLLYITTVSITSIIFGLLLNFIFEITQINPHTQMAHIHHNANFNTIDYILSSFFLLLLMSSVYRKYFSKNKGGKMVSKNLKKYKIAGMTCNHCAVNVEKAIKNVEGVEKVEIILAENIAVVEGTPSPEKIQLAVENIGYKFLGEQE